MVVSTQGLTSLNPFWATSIELEERPDASLVRTSSGEPLNPTPTKAKPDGHWRRKIYPAIEQERGNPRVPVADIEGTPLMPCAPVKARILIKRGKAKPKWSKVGVFYVQLNYAVKKPSNQILAIGVDPGSKFEGLSVVGAKDTVLNIMSRAVDWVKKALEQRRQMRRARRYRKTRRRLCRFSNRLSGKSWIPPSTKARWDAKLRIITQLKRILPLSHAVVEDIKAETRKNQSRWNRNFSPLETGKAYFYRQLKKIGLILSLKTGVETQELRNNFNLEKSVDKFEVSFASHCVDAWCLAASITGAEHPSTKSLCYTVPLKLHRRQLHRLEPEEGGKRKPYGGTMSLGLKRGTLVKHIKYGLCYIGGTLKGRLSLHSLKTGGE